MKNCPGQHTSAKNSQLLPNLMHKRLYIWQERGPVENNHQGAILYIGKDMVPIYTVDGFINVIKTFDPGDELPSHKYKTKIFKKKN